METLISKVRRTIFMGGDLGDVDVDFEIYIDRHNAAIIAVAEGVSGTLVLRNHPIGPSLLAVREANLGYRAAVNEGRFDALATWATRNDIGLDWGDYPEAPVIALAIPDEDEDAGSDPDEGYWDEDAAADAELERRAELAAMAWR